MFSVTSLTEELDYCCLLCVCQRTVMELSQRDRLSELVEELTTSGQPQLNHDKMKEVKKICK